MTHSHHEHLLLPTRWLQLPLAGQAPRVILDQQGCNLPPPPACRLVPAPTDAKVPLAALRSPICPHQPLVPHQLRLSLSLSLPLQRRAYTNSSSLSYSWYEGTVGFRSITMAGGDKLASTQTLAALKQWLQTQKTVSDPERLQWR